MQRGAGDHNDESGHGLGLIVLTLGTFMVIIPYLLD
jgi:hypothetical protein